VYVSGVKHVWKYCHFKLVITVVVFIDSVLHQLRSLVAVNETLKKQESEFRESCKVLAVYLASLHCVVILRSNSAVNLHSAVRLRI